jgi:GT2 family glycosyltransferase
MSARPALADVGVVVIGRNEGARLAACLDSLAALGCARVVYADSASSDGSAELARQRGAEVLVLDRSRPLNAARGRNAGLARLFELEPALAFVFFVDGDCRVVPGFLGAARAELVRDPGLAAVCGRRRELHLEASFYVRVVDSEWNTPVGEAQAFGGDVLVRVAALRSSGGYDEALNQGEDPELAFRLRRAGGRILRIAQDMTWHDVGLTRFSAWAKRHERGGQAYAHGALRHWREPGRYNQRALLSILCWGLALPVFALGASVPSGGASLLALLLYGRLWWRVRAQRVALGDDARHASRYAALIACGKLVEAWGVVRCLWALAFRRRALTVDYKVLPEAAEAGRRAA